MSEIKKHPSQFPKARGDIVKFLMLSDHLFEDAEQLCLKNALNNLSIIKNCC